MIEFACPQCGKKYKLRDELAGRAAKCAQCKATINVPAAPAPADIPFADEKPAEQGFSLGQLAQAEKAAPVAEPDRYLPSQAAAAPPVATPTAPPAGRRMAPRERTPSLMLSVIGAALGAAVGAGIWIGIGYATHYEIGYVAIAVGLLAGVGGVKIGGIQSPAVGVICAAMGLAGVVAGSYGNYYVDAHSQSSREKAFKEFEKAAVAMNPEFRAIPTEKRRELFNKWVDEEFLPNYSYGDYLSSDLKGAGLLAVFGLIGMSVGWKYGSGKHEET